MSIVIVSIVCTLPMLSILEYFVSWIILSGFYSYSLLLREVIDDE